MATNFSSNEIKEPLVLNGKAYHTYCYLTMPYKANGSLIEFLIKANEKEIKLSKEL